MASSFSSSPSSSAFSSSHDHLVPPWLTSDPSVDMALFRREEDPATKARNSQNIGITAFITALNTAIILCVVQILLFILLRNKLARIFKPRTYLVPERERTDPPPANALSMLRRLVTIGDRTIINKCGLDAYFFLRYLKTLLVIFIPICAVVMPILIPINYIGGKGHEVDDRFKDGNNSTNSTTPSGNSSTPSGNNTIPSGLDTLAWGNVSPQHTGRYTAHLLLAIVVVVWVCTVFFFEMRVYIKVRQDYLTSAEHRLRASATTVLVNTIPDKWLTVEALLGLFDVFPGGVRNIWLNRDLTSLLEKVEERNRVHSMLESAETDLIKAVKKAQLKQRNVQEKKKRKQENIKGPSKKERAARKAEQDAEASRMANSDEGTNAGNHEDTGLLSPDLPGGRVKYELETVPEEGSKNPGAFAAHGVKKSLSKVGRGFRGAATKASTDVSGSLTGSHGFMPSIPSGDKLPPSSTRASDHSDQEQHAILPSKSLDMAPTHSRSASAASAASEVSVVTSQRNSLQMPGAGNTVRKLASIEDMYVQQRTRFWQFWKPPSGAYTSPVPQGETPSDLLDEKSLSAWQKFKAFLPFTGHDEEEEKFEYPLAHAPDVKPEDDDEGAEWSKYIKSKDRPTHRLSPFGINWLPGLPLCNEKVDTIYWCRKELARLNLEIEEDQKNPERFPLMRSAFIQFNHQVAAHMACQSVIHHIPRQMAPRMNEISPRDVIWENMALSWWQAWLRAAIVILVVSAMIVLWTVPVAWTAVLSQLDRTLRETHLLGPLENNKDFMNILKGLSGVLPALFLAIVLALVPILLRLLATFKGAKTGAERTEFVQIFFFFFLFVQVFLVVSIASFVTKSFNGFIKNLSALQSITAVLNLLAENLPASANYFFSYMILQGLSTSAGTLLQVAPLFMWFVMAPMFDSTPRNKWSRNTTLKQVEWDSLFPVYTNFACIGLVYCITAPLISIFVVITFSLLWVAQRYTMIYVYRFETDTGGVLYPRAINQTFTGLYFMELLMAGLFFIVRDDSAAAKCTAHGVIMIVVFLLTALYQLALNISFAPLLRYLPITFEDEAVLRDEAFQRAQDFRFGTARHELGADDAKASECEERSSFGENADEKRPGLESSDVRHAAQGCHVVKQMGTLAKDGGHQLRRLKHKSDNSRAVQYRRRQRQRDLEAQRAIGDALYGGVPDDIEDLTPEERDALTRHAFQHYALRARRPTVWIPRDDLGVSDDEIRRTRQYSEHIWISNEGTALDSKVRVVYGKNPPDFSEADIINL
ncbi:hypothetical protein CP532_6718 [Ophiocordyceps camponoti-leonardi (nom. inval.)]|nr:hypothetical protein CP532_6718 [Ophiocordyceps camponoti-leonardi (nom. inval.)]